MRKIYFLFLFALIASLGGISAAEKTYSYAFEKQVFKENGIQTLGDLSWTLDTDAGYFGYDNSNGKGQQFGSSKKAAKYMTLSTSDIKGTIKNIAIETSGASGIKSTLNVTVGGNAFGSEVSLTSSSTKYEFTGSAEGDIAFSYTNSSAKAIYIKSITVVYEEAAATELAAPVISGVEEGKIYRL